MESTGLEPLQAGSGLFRWGSRTYVMGIINATPDSFSGDGVGIDVSAALRLAEQQVRDGADIIDVGGESTRPGASPVAADVELRRAVPVVEAIACRMDVPVSIDTNKAIVARAALESGAVIVNDTTGLRSDAALAATTASAGAAAILMENGRGVTYHDMIPDIVSRLHESVLLATRAGIARSRLIVDPGLGFGKGVDQNLEIIRRLRAFRTLGLPLLVGPSRKSTIGQVLGLGVDDRLEGTAALVALAVANGADLIRVHDVREMVRVARMADAVVRLPCSD
jgi:dihydropteroate synthase